MKKTLFTLLTALSLSSVVAQSTFLDKTCYRGAFAPAPAPMWTDTWTEWDPQNKVYPATTTTVSSNVTTNTTWSTGQVVLLQGPVYVTNSVVLTIQPGVVIKGSLAVAGSGLFVTKGSTLNAVGTAAQPIVFTSDAAPGSRAVGDWGGVILMGQGSNNSPGGINNIEGIATSTLTEYGGGASPNDNDNSGTLKYIRIEFGGYVYAANKEINGLTFGAVGRGTVVDFIQCSFINDDAFEWFGGAVRCKHLVAYRCVDDDFDTDFGFSGMAQYCLGVRDPNLADPTYALPSGASTSEAFESDNDATGSSNTPQTSAIFCNVTDIGPLRGVLTATCHPGFRRGARIRRNSALKIVNSILMDHKTRAVFIDGTSSENNAVANTLIFKNNILAGYGQKATENQTVVTAFNTTINAWVANNANDTLLSAAGILVNPYNYLTPDYRPAAGSIAASGASYTDAVIAAATNTFASNNLVAGIPTTVCVGDGTTTVPFTWTSSSTVSANYCSMWWSVSAGVVISSSTSINPSFTISTTGTHTVTLWVTDANGTQSVVSTVISGTCMNASVHENNSTFGNILLQPNPSSDATKLVINSNIDTKSTISVIDVTGKVINELSYDENLRVGLNELQLNTINLSNGIYFVTISSPLGKETVKLIVNH